MAGAHSAAGGFHPHLPGLGHRLTAKLLGASMWFFIFYRAGDTHGTDTTKRFDQRTNGTEDEDECMIGLRREGREYRIT
ncbi:hypothetical protein MNV49_006580 [Pseudohyphozyma bogoriensis]|nr:hypothetical protein MNV49_006580 [Pseudohyphozyma bogoriensis]